MGTSPPLSTWVYLSPVRVQQISSDDAAPKGTSRASPRLRLRVSPQAAVPLATSLPATIIWHWAASRQPSCLAADAFPPPCAPYHYGAVIDAEPFCSAVNAFLDTFMTGRTKTHPRGSQIHLREAYVRAFHERGR